MTQDYKCELHSRTNKNDRLVASTYRIYSIYIYIYIYIYGDETRATHGNTWLHLPLNITISLSDYPILYIYIIQSFITRAGIFLMSNLSTSAEQRNSLPRMREAFACHGEVFEISCDGDEILVFETARYGRGTDPTIASLCRVPYSPVCDVDVRFSLNRACAGHRRCMFPVDSVSFGGPCGYDEFLAVIYRCVSG